MMQVRRRIAGSPFLDRDVHHSRLAHHGVVRPHGKPA